MTTNVFRRLLFGPAALILIACGAQQSSLPLALSPGLAVGADTLVNAVLVHDTIVAELRRAGGTHKEMWVINSEGELVAVKTGHIILTATDVQRARLPDVVARRRAVDSLVARADSQR